MCIQILLDVMCHLHSKNIAHREMLSGVEKRRCISVDRAAVRVFVSSRGISVSFPQSSEDICGDDPESVPEKATDIPHMRIV